jgi:hypothetical protein
VERSLRTKKMQRPLKAQTGGQKLLENSDHPVRSNQGMPVVRLLCEEGLWRVVMILTLDTGVIDRHCQGSNV